MWETLSRAARSALARIALALLAPFVGLLCFAVAPAQALVTPASVLAGDALDTAAEAGVFAGADVACAATVVCPAAMTLGVLGLAVWETKDTWVGFGSWAWDAITGGGDSQQSAGTDATATLCFGSDGSMLATSVVAGKVTFTLNNSACGSNRDVPVETINYTCGSYSRGGSFSNSGATEVYYGHPVSYAGIVDASGQPCTPSSVTSAWGWGGNASWMVIKWGGAAYSYPASAQSMTTITTCGGPEGSTDKLLTSVAPWIRGGVTVTPCSSLGSDWYPKQVSVTRSANGVTTDPDVETFPAPTGQLQPVPGTAGQVVTGYNPTTGDETTTDPDTNGSYTPGTSADPAVSDSGGCLPSGWGWFNPVDWVEEPVKCALEWAFEPDVSSWGVSDLVNTFETRPPGSIVTGVAQMITGAIGSFGGGCGVVENWNIEGHSAAIDCNVIRSSTGFTAIYDLVDVGLWVTTGLILWNMMEGAFTGGGGDD